MRVLAFGDSITQGYWDTKGGWVGRCHEYYTKLQLSDLENLDEPAFFNLGISADNSGNILRRIGQETIARTRPNETPLVIIQVGTNDASTDKLPTSETVSLPLEQYRANLTDAVRLVRPLSTKVILVGLSPCEESRTTPVRWGEFHYQNDRIKQYEDVMRDVATEQNVPFIPIFDQFATEVNAGKDLLQDGLHPNNDGHQLLYEIVMQKLPSLIEA